VPPHRLTLIRVAAASVRRRLEPAPSRRRSVAVFLLRGSAVW
jgi:hypothetical protein